MKCKNNDNQISESSPFFANKNTAPNRWFLPTIVLFSLLLVGGCFGIYYGLKSSKLTTQMNMITVRSNDDLMGVVRGEGKYAKSANITIEAIPNKNYRFVSWSDGNNERIREIKVDSDIEFVAFFETKPMPKFEITVMSSNPQWGTVSGGGTYDSLSVVTIEAQSKNDYQFTMWNDGNTERKRKLVIDCDQRYVAHFSEKPKSNSSTNPSIAPTVKKYWFGIYEGNLKNGIPEGIGTMYYNCRVQIAKHDTDNHPHYAENGDYYVGSWGNGDIEWGKLYNKNGELKEIIRAPKRTNLYDLNLDKFLNY